MNCRAERFFWCGTGAAGRTRAAESANSVAVSAAMAGSKALKIFSHARGGPFKEPAGLTPQVPRLVSRAQGNNMAKDFIGYQALTDAALRGVVRDALRKI